MRPAGPYDTVRLAGKGGPAPAFANMVNVLYVGELGLGCYQAIAIVRRSVGGWFNNVWEGCFPVWRLLIPLFSLEFAGPSF